MNEPLPLLRQNNDNLWLYPIHNPYLELGRLADVWHLPVYENQVGDTMKLKWITIKNVARAALDDFGYKNGGWVFFMGRLLVNSIFLYYGLRFLNGFFLYSFKANGVTDPDKLGLIPTLLWAVGIVYLVLRISIYPESIEDRDDT